MKYTVITGASSGIGYETALAFAGRGKNLILGARRESELEKLKAKILAQHPELDVVIRKVDLSDMDETFAFDGFTEDYEVETWINNAGFGNFDPVGNQDLYKIEDMLNVNVEALTILSSLYVERYGDVPGAQLINVSSAGGYSLIGNAITYCASKFYVSAFTEGLAHELQDLKKPLRAKVLAPAATETEFAKLARNTTSFDYTALPKYHTAQEMAGFLLDLYDSDKVLGLVNGLTYEFELRDPIYPYYSSITR